MLGANTASDDDFEDSKGFEVIKKKNKKQKVLPELECKPSPMMIESQKDVAENFFKCPLSGELMCDPVVAVDGVTYERSFIEVWLLFNNTSPKTRLNLHSKILTPNLALKDAAMSLYGHKYDHPHKKWLIKDIFISCLLGPLHLPTPTNRRPNLVRARSI